MNGSVLASGELRMNYILYVKFECDF